VNWKQGEGVIIAGSVSDEEAKKAYPGGLEGAQALPPHRATAEVVDRQAPVTVSVPVGWGSCWCGWSAKRRPWTTGSPDLESLTKRFVCHVSQVFRRRDFLCHTRC
jgi:hypothetical protein